MQIILLNHLNTKCFFEQEGKPFFYDQIHLTELGAKKVNQKIISIIKEIEKK